MISFPSSAVEDKSKINLGQPLNLECITSSANIQNERNCLTSDLEDVQGRAINLKKYVTETKDEFDTSNNFSFLL